LFSTEYAFGPQIARQPEGPKSAACIIQAADLGGYKTLTELSILNYAGSLSVITGTQPAMITINNLSYTRSGRTLLSGFSLQVNQGEKALIHGKSGTGKTSILKLILGFELPDTGQVLVNRRPVTKEHIKDIRGDVFYLSQDVDLPDLFGEEIIAAALASNHQPTPSGQQMDTWLKRLSFQQALLSQPTSRLSGGERQRLGLLLCFLLDRPIWLLDEPTSALDREMKSRVAHYISGTEKTVLVISHDETWQAIPGMTMKAWQ
jgi:putative ABC transport system ATP-binding protein